MNPIRFFHGHPRNAWRASLLAGLICASAGLVAACGAGSAAAPPPAAAATTPPLPAATATSVPPPAPAIPPTPPRPPSAAPNPPAPPQAATAAALPAYQPSRVVSSGHGSAYLVSPDPVGKVSGFYAQLLSKDGWQLVSRHVSSHAAELVGKRQAQGVRVQIFAAGNGSTILVASYGAA